MPTSCPPLPPACLAQEGDEFVAAADSYVRKYLLRGIPSLFTGVQACTALEYLWFVFSVSCLQTLLLHTRIHSSLSCHCLQT